MRLIDADALNSAIMSDHAIQCGTTFQHVLLQIKHAPTVDAEPVRHGKWRFRGKSLDCLSFKYICSECKSLEFAHTPYCPHCGAKMDGGETSNENA